MNRRVIAGVAWVLLAPCLTANGLATRNEADSPLPENAVALPVAQSASEVPGTAAASPVVPESPVTLDSSTKEYMEEVGRAMGVENSGGGAVASPSRVEINPPAQAASDLMTRMWRMLAALTFVLALIVFLVYLWKKLGGRTALLAGPHLAKTLGTVYLSRGVSLHYLQSGGRVLVVGVTPSTVTLVAEFDGDAFEPARAPQAASPSPEEGDFLSRLLASTREIKAPRTAARSADESELDALRSDIERLQRNLQELSRESGD